MQPAVPLTPRHKVRNKVEPFPVHYANSLELEVSPWDFKLYFGQIEEATAERLGILESVAVYVSPQHAKAITDILVAHIKTYEATFGPIPMPPRGGSENGRQGDGPAS
jgi:hypothetical protein